MQLDSVMTSFKALCDAPMAWVVVGLIALKTAASLYHYAVCPLVRGGDYGIDAETAHAMVQRPLLHSPRFLVLMVVGLALAIGGLYGLPNPVYGPLALAAVMLGVFLLIVEPSQLSIDENQLRVIAATAGGPEAQALAVERLRYSHMERIGLELGLTALVAAVVIAY